MKYQPRLWRLPLLPAATATAAEPPPPPPPELPPPEEEDPESSPPSSLPPSSPPSSSPPSSPPSSACTYYVYVPVYEYTSGTDHQYDISTGIYWYQSRRIKWYTQQMQMHIYDDHHAHEQDTLAQTPRILRKKERKLRL